jgi:hypothetical protein
MKISVLTVFILFTSSLIAQTHQMIKHNGVTVDINLIKIENNLVYYTFPQSLEEQSISKYAVAKLMKSQNDSFYCL